jgi:hypothetical protein
VFLTLSGGSSQTALRMKRNNFLQPRAFFGTPLASAPWAGVTPCAATSWCVELLARFLCRIDLHFQIGGTVVAIARIMPTFCRIVGTILARRFLFFLSARMLFRHVSCLGSKDISLCLTLLLARFLLKKKRFFLLIFP